MKRILLVTTVSFLIFNQAKAATQTIYGPQKFSSNNTKNFKEYNANFTNATDNVDALVTVVNGNGKDLSFQVCSGNFIQKLICGLGNIAREIEVLIDRPTVLEISINNVVVESSSQYKPKLGQQQFYLKVKLANTLKLKVKGLPTSDVTVSVAASTTAPTNNPPVAVITSSVDSGIAPETISFSGILSSDPDGNMITSYQWDFGDGTTGSGSLINHTYSSAGTYTVRLTVADNLGASGFITKTITIRQNQLPVAKFTALVQADLGEFKVVLDASSSTDADGSIASYEFNFGDNTTGTEAKLSHIYEAAGTYNIVLKVTDNKGGANNITQSVVVKDAVAPVLSLVSPTEGVVLSSNQVSIQGTANEKISEITAQISGGPVSSISLNSDQKSFSGLLSVINAGNKSLILNAKDLSGNATSLTINFSVDFSLPPVASLNSPIPSSGVFPLMVYLDASASTDPQNSQLTYIWNFGDGNTQTTTIPTVSHEFKTLGNFDVKLTVKNQGGKTDEKSVVVSTVNPIIPQDPKEIAPALSQVNSPKFEDSIKFLYQGQNPIQVNVADGVIKDQTVAIVRGKVLDPDGSPLAGVEISVLGQSILGKTYTRLDGKFDLVVNGGGNLTLQYSRNGYFDSQRQISPDWKDNLDVDDVVMKRPDSKVTVVESQSVNSQIVQGTKTQDFDGERTATVIIPPQTTIQLIMPNGSKKTLSKVSLRATEYTIGENGPSSMPGTLPATSGYTYAVDVSADEAMAFGAKHVEFSKPVAFYVENFLGFSVGGVVPVGSYDADKGLWVPQPNGRVIKVLEIVQGKAVLDVMGTNQAATTDELATLGIDDAELVQISKLYASGTSLWRVAAKTFSPIDLNWPIALSGISGPVDQPDSSLGGMPKDVTNHCGSIIDIETQNLRESIPISGTPYSLYYNSGLMDGKTAEKNINIILSGSSVPQGLKSIKLKINILGQVYESTFGAYPNLKYSYTWNGKDQYGREWLGGARGSIKISYVYDSNYFELPDQTQEYAFSRIGNYSVTSIKSRKELVFDRTFGLSFSSASLHTKQSASGWTVDINHFLDRSSKVLYYGDGKIKAGANIGHVVTTVAGSASGSPVEGTPAVSAPLLRPDGVLVSKSGVIYIADIRNYKIYKIDLDGIITTFAGTGVAGATADGVLATNAKLSLVGPMAEGNDGSLYFIDGYRIRKIDSSGTLITVAGTGSSGYTGNDGPALNARLENPIGLAVSKDGTVYYSEYDRGVVRRIDLNGIISVYAGTGTSGYSGDGGRATLARLYVPYALAFGDDGTLYVADTFNRLVRAISPDGIISTIAGIVSNINQPAAIPAQTKATDIAVGGVTSIVTDKDGSIYLAANSNILKIDSQGYISKIAGNASSSQIADNVLATQSKISPWRISKSADGTIYMAEGSIGKVRKIISSLQLQQGITASSSDGNEIYVFNENGKHSQTLYGKTGAAKYQFAYDSESRLSSITDGNGNVTTVERNSSGQPTKIISPNGQVTTLSQDVFGFLSVITNPNNESYKMTYSYDGMMATFENPKGAVSKFKYDTMGRLTLDTSAAGSIAQLTRLLGKNAYEVPLSTALGRTTGVKYEALGSVNRKTTTFPNGTSLVSDSSTDNSTIVTSSVGDVAQSVDFADPRLGGMSTYTSSGTITTPSGLKKVLARNKSATVRTGKFDFTQTDSIKVNNKTSTQVYESTNKTLTITSPQGRSSVLQVNSQERPVYVSSGGITPITMTYNSKGLVQSTQQGTRSSNFTYNAQGYLESYTNTLNQTTYYTYDNVGRVLSQTLPDGRVIGYRYDLNGNVLGITPSGRPEHSFILDIVDAVTSYLPPSLSGQVRSTNYSYNLDRQLEKITRPDGNEIVYNYSSTSGKLRSVAVPNGQYTYSYNSATGLLAGITSPDGISNAYTYDGSLIKTLGVSGSASSLVEFNYNSDFNLSSTSVNGGFNIVFSYDNDGLLTSAGSQSLVYNTNNALLSTTLLGTVAETYGYNNFAEMTSYQAIIGSSNFYSSILSRDNSGKISSQTVNGDNYSYQYDLSGRLISALRNGISNSYNYDQNGNRISATINGNYVQATYDSQDRLLSYGNKVFSYGENGEVASIVEGGLTKSFSYDTIGNLKKVTVPSKTIEYILDGQDRRVGKKINGVLTQGFVYQNQLQIIAEIDSSNNVVSRFVYASKSNVPDYMIKSGVTYKIISDHLGSPRVVVNSSNGSIMQQIDYDEFGNILADTNPGFQPFGFAGGIFDYDTQLLHFGVREYNAEIGRWMSKDPIGFAGGDTGLYTYCGNDVINCIDPSGKFGFLGAGFGFVAGLTGAYISSGGDPLALAIGGTVGAAVGFFAPNASLSAGALASSFVFGAVENLIGQGVGNIVRTGEISTSAALSKINIGSIIGSGVGSVFSTAISVPLDKIGIPNQLNGAISGVISGLISNLFGDENVNVGQALGMCPAKK